MKQLFLTSLVVFLFFSCENAEEKRYIDKNITQEELVEIRELLNCKNIVAIDLMPKQYDNSNIYAFGTSKGWDKFELLSSVAEAFDRINETGNTMFENGVSVDSIDGIVIYAVLCRFPDGRYAVFYINQENKYSGGVIIAG